MVGQLVIRTYRSEYRSILQSASCRSISFKIMPVFKATSSFSYLFTKFSLSCRNRQIKWWIVYPLTVVNNTSCFEHKYSTVGHLEPICLRRRLLNICATSFRDSKSRRGMLMIRIWSRSVLYVSWASCATSSGCGSASGK